MQEKPRSAINIVKKDLTFIFRNEYFIVGISFYWLFSLKFAEQC